MKKKIIFLISGMNSWENTLPLIHKLNKNIYDITIGIETSIFFTKFINDDFRKNLIKEKNIFLLHLARPRNLRELFVLFAFYIRLIIFKYNYIIETLDFDRDLKITKYFLKFQILKKCKRIKNFADSTNFKQGLNTQIFYKVLKTKQKIYDFRKYNYVLVSNNYKNYYKIYKNFIIFPTNKKLIVNIGKPKFENNWIKYILNFYQKENKYYDILIPLTATEGNFIKGNNAQSQDKKLSTIFEVLNDIGNLKIVLKPHSKTNLKIIENLKKKYKSIKIRLETSHLYYLFSISKIILTYHPTSSQIYAKIFKKKSIEFGDYDQRIQKVLNNQPRYGNAVDVWIKKDKNKLKRILIKYLKKNYKVSKLRKFYSNNNFIKLIS